MTGGSWQGGSPLQIAPDGTARWWGAASTGWTKEALPLQCFSARRQATAHYSRFIHFDAADSKLHSSVAGSLFVASHLATLHAFRQSILQVPNEANDMEAPRRQQIPQRNNIHADGGATVGSLILSPNPEMGAQPLRPSYHQQYPQSHYVQGQSLTSSPVYARYDHTPAAHSVESASPGSHPSLLDQDVRLLHRRNDVC
ncbi:hypothetical protein K474DRAFT_1711887 [Panus rudis PR-1116 ss-1]|nr:hypothetical protein K474DRAFT_1711887 [Panus rudis PR-1116 ss-1]